MTAVLFVRLSAMGDLVQSLGAVAELHRVRPEWRLSFVTQSAWAGLLTGFPGIGRVVTFDRRAGLGEVWRLRGALRSERYDVAIDLQGNWKSAAIAWLSGARRRVGMAAPFRQEPASRVLLTETIASDAAVAHPARCAWELVRRLAPQAVFAVPRLAATDGEVADESAAVAALGIDPSRPFRVVVLTDPGDPRSLLPSIVAAETRASSHPVLHLYGPAESHLEPVAGVPVLRHGKDPRRLIALGTLVARAGGDVLGPDQGATHVLAAAGARCLVWFGAQDARRTAPPASTALVHPQSPSCSPCRRERCNHPQGRVCMDFRASEGRIVDAAWLAGRDSA